MLCKAKCVNWLFISYQKARPFFRNFGPRAGNQSISAKHQNMNSISKFYIVFLNQFGMIKKEQLNTQEQSMFKSFNSLAA